MHDTRSETGSSTSGHSAFAKIDWRDDVLMVRPVGPTVAARESQIISSEAGAVITNASRPLRALVLDLTDVGMLASMGLGMCIELRNHAHQRKARTIICGMRDDIAQMFKMMKLERMFTIARNEQELAKALK